MCANWPGHATCGDVAYGVHDTLLEHATNERICANDLFSAEPYCRTILTAGMDVRGRFSVDHLR